MSIILDDQTKLLSVDQSKMCGIEELFPDLCEDALSLSSPLTFPEEVKISRNKTVYYRLPKHVVVTGMGGSAIGGDILKSWLEDRLQVPLTVNREYQLPKFIDDESLVMAISYSGNTEETLSSFVDAVERGCMTFAVCSGGLLEEFNRRLSLPYLKVPSGYPPRSALPYLFLPLAVALQKVGLLDSFESEVTEAIKVARMVRENIRMSTPTKLNPAKSLATSIKGSIPMVCGFGYFTAIAKRIKTQYNENAKSPAKFEFFPELNHNETVGWSGNKALTRILSVVLIRSEDEPPEVRARIEVTRKLVFDGGASKVLEINAVGKGKLAKMLSAMYIGDFSSVYLGILYGFDPTPIPIIDELKKQLKMHVNKTEELKDKIKKIVEN